MRIKNLIKKNIGIVLSVGTLIGMNYIANKLTESAEREFQKMQETPLLIEDFENHPRNFQEFPEQNREYRYLLLYGNPFDENLTAGTFDEYSD